MAKSMTYDASTGQWVSSSAGDSSGGSSNSGSSTPQSSSTPSTTTPPSNPDKDASSSESESQYNDIDYYNLQGDISYIATENTIKIKAGDTVTLEGLGMYLSGDYYMMSVSRKMDSGGYTHSGTVLKMDFGAKLKVVQNPTPPAETPTVSAQPEQRSCVVAKGDCLWSLAKKYYGDGSKYTLIYEANKSSIGSNPNLIMTGATLIIP